MEGIYRALLLDLTFTSATTVIINKRIYYPLFIIDMYVYVRVLHGPPVTSLLPIHSSTLSSSTCVPE